MKLGRDFDWVIVLCVACLSGIGLAVVYSVSQSVGEVSAVAMHGTHFARQLIWLGAGVLIMLIAFAVPFRMFESLAFASYAVCLIMLVVVLMLPARGETQRWFIIGPLAIQPSEFTKVAVILVWARILSTHRADPNKLRTLIPVFILFIVPFLLVLKQPDLGTAMVFAGIVMPVLFWRGFRGLHILFLLSPIVSSILIIYGENVTHNPWPFGIFIVLILIVAYMRRAFLVESISLVVANVGIGLFLPALWAHLKPYQQRRVTNFLDPDSDKLGAGWQVIQSKIAIGSGGFGGKGYLEGTQKALEYLPAKHTDFIFSVLGEELGFVGAFAVLVLFAILITRALMIAQKAKSEFAATLCVGIASYFAFQVFVNIGMTSGIAPVAGIPLPFVSYGGSSMLVSCFLVGLLLNCAVRWGEY
ncbi:MAG TPA: rod shape-determining protein RodA [Candidatus Krumholzibacteria bacterium]|nr:rod shape-determining protein RodA [Candidatus Krumholzibacteria bacterium]